MKRRTYLVALASTVALAGCTGVSPPSRASGSAAESSTTTATDGVVQYRDLSDEGKDVFEALLETELVGPKSDFPADIWRAEYVEYEGTTYAIERDQTGEYISNFALRTEFKNETAVGSESDVIAFDELYPSAQDAFETARSDGRYESRGEPPSQLVENDYVRYEDDYYELTQVVADISEWELSATKTDQ